MFKYFFDVSILILRKLLYPRHIVVFYFKKIYDLHFFAKHLIKFFFFLNIQVILILDFIGIAIMILTHILILKNLSQESWEMS